MDTISKKKNRGAKFLSTFVNYHEVSLYINQAWYYWKYWLYGDYYSVFLLKLVGELTRT